MYVSITQQRILPLSFGMIAGHRCRQYLLMFARQSHRIYIRVAVMWLRKVFCREWHNAAVNTVADGWLRPCDFHFLPLELKIISDVIYKVAGQNSFSTVMTSLIRD